MKDWTKLEFSEFLNIFDMLVNFIYFFFSASREVLTLVLVNFVNLEGSKVYGFPAIFTTNTTVEDLGLFLGSAVKIDLKNSRRK